MKTNIESIEKIMTSEKPMPYKISRVKRAISELVRECVGGNRIGIKADPKDEWQKGCDWGYNFVKDEIRTAFKEAGVEI